MCSSTTSLPLVGGGPTFFEVPIHFSRHQKLSGFTEIGRFRLIPYSPQIISWATFVVLRYLLLSSPGARRRAKVLEGGDSLIVFFFACASLCWFPPTGRHKGSAACFERSPSRTDFSVSERNPPPTSLGSPFSFSPQFFPPRLL